MHFLGRKGEKRREREDVNTAIKIELINLKSNFFAGNQQQEDDQKKG